MADGNDQGTTTSPSTAGSTTATKASIIKRIESLFSRENLTSDVNLQYQMNYECYVPISAVIHHPKIRELTSDAELVTEAIKSTSIVSLDETKNYVKPAYKIPRVTIILREIASSTPSEEVEKIFEGDDSAKPIKVKSEVGDNWYVTFANEDDMMKAFLATRTRKFNGEPVKARIKSETLAKSFFYPATVIADPQTQYSGYQPGQHYYTQYSGRGRGGAGPSGSGPSVPTGSSGPHPTNGRGGYNGSRGGRGAPTKKGEYRKPNPNYNPPNSTSDSQATGGDSTYIPHPRNPSQRPHYSKEHPYPQRDNGPINENAKETNASHHPRAPPKEGSVQPSDTNKKRTSTGRRRTGSETKQQGNHGGAFQLGNSHFPPLPSKESNSSASGVATSGYSKEFRKHTHAAIVDAVKGLSETGTTRPDSLPTTEECPAVLQKPRQISEIENSRTPSPSETSVHSEIQEVKKVESPASLALPSAAASPSPTPSTTTATVATSTTTNSSLPTSPPSPSSSTTPSPTSSPSTSSSSLWSQIVGNKTAEGKK